VSEKVMLVVLMSISCFIFFDNYKFAFVIL